VLSRQKKGPW
jgi:hypothetical protein